MERVQAQMMSLPFPAMQESVPLMQQTFSFRVENSFRLLWERMWKQIESQIPEHLRGDLTKRDSDPEARSNKTRNDWLSLIPFMPDFEVIRPDSSRTDSLVRSMCHALARE